MPLGDKTGPRGLGPRTGRGLGGCLPGGTNLGNSPVRIGRGFGRGVGAGRGGGRGRGLNRNWNWGGFSRAL